MTKTSPETRRLSRLLAALGVLCALVTFSLSAGAQTTPAAPSAAPAPAAPAPMPAMGGGGGGGLKVEVELGEEGGRYATAIRIFLMLTLISLAPALLLSVTSFTRIVVVLGFLRQATGVQQLPPNQVLIGLALFLSIFSMTPVWNQVKTQAIDPYDAGQISESEALSMATAPLRDFMLTYANDEDIALFLGATGQVAPDNPADLSLFVVVPAFMLSELKTAFQMGAMLFFPFLVIDLIVASILMSMGMMMVPPVMVSLPIKLILFVLVDGWHLVVTSLFRSLGLG